MKNTQSILKSFFKEVIFSLMMVGLTVSSYSQVVGPGDWSSLRLYGHAFDIDDFTEEEYDWIANHFYYFTIEKRHAFLDYGTPSSERASATTAAKIVANNSKCHPLFYWNTKVVYDNIYETIQGALVDHPEWNNSGNWSYEDPEFRAWFVDVVKDMVNNYAHDGVFLDGALSVGGSIGADAANYLRDMMAEMPGPTIFNGFGPNTHYGRFDYLETAEGIFLEHFFKSQCDNLEKGKKMLDDLLMVPNDVILLANSAPQAFWNNTDHKFSLAAFLIIANDNSYFRWMPSGSWSATDLMLWEEDFGKYIGAPKGVAQVNGYVYTRSFDNVEVTVDLLNKTCSIIWGDKTAGDCDGNILPRTEVYRTLPTSDTLVEASLIDSVIFKPQVNINGVTSTGDNGIWTWSGPNSFLQTGRNVIFEPVTATDFGNYTVNYKLDNCDFSQEFELNEELVTSVNNELELLEVHIYPNPTDSQIYIEGSQGSIVELYSNTGELKLSTEVSDDNYQIDMNSFSSGLYILKVNSSSGSITEKIVKE